LWSTDNDTGFTNAALLRYQIGQSACGVLVAHVGASTQVVRAVVLGQKVNQLHTRSYIPTVSDAPQEVYRLIAAALHI